jgi:hypothetical protein
VNIRRTIKCVSLAAFAAMVLLIVALFPRSRSLPEGYTYTYFPRGGHRYIIDSAGIKKVGQEVLDYQVSWSVVTGMVRLRLEHDDVRPFRLDLKTATVTLGDRIQSDTH